MPGSKPTLNQSAECLRQGGVIAYPTEGVWGLGCDPANLEAVNRILAIKARPADKGLILVAASAEQLRPFLAPLSRELTEKLTAYTEVPTSWVCPAAHGYPWLTGGRDTIAVRLSKHPVVRDLCLLSDRAIVSTSANITGSPAARTIEEVEQLFSESVDIICPGSLGDQTGASEIRDLLSDQIIRQAS